MTPTETPPLPTKRYMDDCRWLEAHLDELTRQYPDQWIAVHEEQVLAAGPNLGLVAATARAKSQATDIVFEFVNSGALIF